MEDSHDQSARQEDVFDESDFDYDFDDDFEEETDEEIEELNAAHEGDFTSPPAPAHYQKESGEKE